MFGYLLIFVSICGAVLTASPQYSFPKPDHSFDMGVFNQSLQSKLPTFLVYPKGVYMLMNATNTTQNLNASRSHDFVFGVRTPRDQLLLRTTIFKKVSWNRQTSLLLFLFSLFQYRCFLFQPKLFSNYVRKTITFPPPSSLMRVNVSQVIAHDMGFNKTGGFVKITEGGIGKGNVTLLFSSLKNLPIHFALEIYGTLKL